MAEIAEAYIHLRPYELDRGQLNSLGESALEIAAEIAKEVYGGNVTVELVLEEGSAKFWTTVNAALIAGHVGYGMIADWKAFKEQVTEWVSDAKRFGDKVTTGVVNNAGAKPSQVYRTERRRKAPGKLRRLIDRLEDLNETARITSRDQLLRDIEDIVGKELAALHKELSEGEMRYVLNALKFENLPPLDRLPRRKESDRVPKTAAIDRTQRQDELELDYLVGGRTASPPPDPPRRLTYRKQVFIAPTVTLDEEVEIKHSPIQGLLY